MWKSASVHWSASYPIKKTPDPRALILEESQEEKARLRDDYEQMRAYALSPEKTPDRPLGLDLCLKKGFLSWLLALIHKESSPIPNGRKPMPFTESDLSSAIIMPLANILLKRSVEYDGTTNRQNEKRTSKPQGISVHTAIHSSSGN